MMKKIVVISFLLLSAFWGQAHSFGPDLSYSINRYLASEWPSTVEQEYETATGKRFPSYSDDDMVLELWFEDTTYLVFFTEVATWDATGNPNAFSYEINFVYDKDSYEVLSVSQAPKVAARAKVFMRSLESSVRINVSQEYIENEMELVSGSPVAKAVLLANYGLNAVNEWLDVAYNQINEGTANVVSMGKEWIWDELIYGPISSEIAAAGLSESEIRSFLMYDDTYDALVGGQKDSFLQCVDSAYSGLASKIDGATAVGKVKAQVLERSINAYLMSAKHGASGTEAVKAAFRGGSREIAKSTGTLIVGVILLVNDSTGLPAASADFLSAAEYFERVVDPVEQMSIYGKYVPSYYIGYFEDIPVEATLIEEYSNHAKESYAGLISGFESTRAGMEKINWTFGDLLDPRHWGDSKEDALQELDDYLTLLNGIRSYWGDVSDDFVGGSTFALDVASSPSGAAITLSKTDENGDKNGTTSFDREYKRDTQVTLTAPTTADGRPFKEWRIGGHYYSSSRSISVTLDADKTARAVYENEPDDDLEVGGSTNPDPFPMSLAPRHGSGVIIPVKNLSYSNVAVNCFKSGSASSWTTLETESFTLSSQKIRQYEVDILIPSDASSGDYIVDIDFNGVVQRIQVRVVGSDIPYTIPSQMPWVGSGVWIDGKTEGSKSFSWEGGTDYLSGTHDDTTWLFDLTADQYARSRYGVFSFYAAKVNAASEYDLGVSVNNNFQKKIYASSVDQSVSEYVETFWFEDMEEGSNDIKYQLSRYNSFDTNVLWKIVKEKPFSGNLSVSMTEAAWGEGNIDIDSTVWRDMEDDYDKYIHLYATVDFIGKSGDVHLYNNGDLVDSENISSSDLGDEVYWWFSDSEIDEDDNYFVLKGDTGDDTRVKLSKIRFEVAWLNAVANLDVTQTITSNPVLAGTNATVQIRIENNGEDSTTGDDTDLTCAALPAGVQKVSGDLYVGNIGDIGFEDYETHSYVIKANQPGQYVIGRSRVDYENIDGDNLNDESNIAILEVSGGALDIVETIQIHTDADETIVACAADVLASDGSHIEDANVVATLHKDNAGSWDLVEEWPLGYDPESLKYRGDSPMLQQIGDYKVVISASREFYDDDQSDEHFFSITVPTYQLTVNNGDGDGSYSEGDEVSISANAPAEGESFEKWIVDPSQYTTNLACTTSSNTTFTMPANNITVEATYIDKYYFLYVNSQYGTPDPSTGENRITEFSVVDCSVDSPASDGSSTQYVCDGWTMTGHEPASGSSNSFSMTITNNASLTWLWSTNYYLTTEISGPGSVDVPSGWVNTSEPLTLKAKPDGGFRLKHWLVNGEITAKGQKTLTLENITSDMTVEAVFEKIKAMPWLNLLLE